jgi:hypothetical protein
VEFAQDNLFVTNNKIHEHKRFNNNLHLPMVNLTKYEKGAYIVGIKVFNRLPQYIKILVDNEISFKVSLRRFPYHNSFYSMQEYYQHMEKGTYN